MSDKSDAAEGGILGLIFEATTFEGIGEDDSSSPATVLVAALHTADPGEAGTQSTNEVSYTNYARQEIARGGSPAGWVRTGNSVSPAENIAFPEAGSGANTTATHGSIGLPDGTILYKGPITPNIEITEGVTPRLLSSSTITED